MGKPEEYRRYAAECLELASVFQSPKTRAVLLHMAQTWFRLADEGVPLYEPVGTRATNPISKSLAGSFLLQLPFSRPQPFFRAFFGDVLSPRS